MSHIILVIFHDLYFRMYEKSDRYICGNVSWRWLYFLNGKLYGYQYFRCGIPDLFILCFPRKGSVKIQSNWLGGEVYDPAKVYDHGWTYPKIYSKSRIEFEPWRIAAQSRTNTRKWKTAELNKINFFCIDAIFRLL